MKELKNYTISELLNVCLCYKGHSQCFACPIRKIFINDNSLCRLLNNNRIHYIVNNEFDLSCFDNLVSLDVIKDNSLRLVLVRNGFVALNELVKFSKKDLFKLRGFGIVKYNLLVQYLQKYFDYKEF